MATTSVKRTKKQQTSSEKVSKTAKTVPTLTTTNTFQDLLLLVDEVDADENSTPQVNDTDSGDHSNDGCIRKSSYTLGYCQDRVMDVTPNEVTITSTLEPRKTIKFDINRWAHFIRVLAQVDDNAKELNRKSRAVAYRERLGDGYYVSVTTGWRCVDIRKYYVPCGLPNDQVRPTKAGISLRLDEWCDLMTTIPSIHRNFPELASAKCCTDDDSHLGQRGWMECTSCFPFGHDFSVWFSRTVFWFCLTFDYFDSYALFWHYQRWRMMLVLMMMMMMMMTIKMIRTCVFNDE